MIMTHARIAADITRLAFQTQSRVNIPVQGSLSLSQPLILSPKSPAKSFLPIDGALLAAFSPVPCDRLAPASSATTKYAASSIPFPRRPQAEPSDAGATSDDRPSKPESDDFDSRLAQVRLKYRSGTGKKAEMRKSRKSGGGGSSSKKGSLFLPAIPLKEPVSDGLKVDFGFNHYTERLNGRLAALGLAALLLVELGSGKSLISYHAPPVLFLQVYTVAAAAALFIKYEKEKISIWPQKRDSGAA